MHREFSNVTKIIYESDDGQAITSETLIWKLDLVEKIVLRDANRRIAKAIEFIQTEIECDEDWSLTSPEPDLRHSHGCAKCKILNELRGDDE